MSDLINQVREAQTRAGEDAVMADLEAKGLLSPEQATLRNRAKIALAGELLVQACHDASYNAGWWGSIIAGGAGGTDLDLYRNEVRNNTRFGKALVAEKLALIHSEISEGMEGHRKGKMDDKLTHRPMIEVELADAVIRIADLAGALQLDLGGAIAEKMAFNAVRPDHKIENRAAEGGKAY